jgi:hypothetical protein
MFVHPAIGKLSRLCSVLYLDEIILNSSRVTDMKNYNWED